MRGALFGGPDALSIGQKMRLIDNPDALAELHREVWTSADVHAGWRDALPATPVPAQATDAAAELRVALDPA